jgi:hypothetical protein
MKISCPWVRPGKECGAVLVNDETMTEVMRMKRQQEAAERRRRQRLDALRSMEKFKAAQDALELARLDLMANVRDLLRDELLWQAGAP